LRSEVEADLRSATRRAERLARAPKDRRLVSDPTNAQPRPTPLESTSSPGGDRLRTLTIVQADERPVYHATPYANPLEENTRRWDHALRATQREQQQLPKSSARIRWDGPTLRHPGLANRTRAPSRDARTPMIAPSTARGTSVGNRHSNRHAARNIPAAQCAFESLMIH